jgi:hypothetical protein
MMNRIDMVAIVLLTFVVGCPQRLHVGGPWFYSSINPMTKPPSPEREITEADIKELDNKGYNHVEVHYDDEGRIQRDRKISRGKILSETTYYYHSNMYCGHVWNGENDKSTIVRYYDKAGLTKIVSFWINGDGRYEVGVEDIKGKRRETMTMDKSQLLELTLKEECKVDIKQ